MFHAVEKFERDDSRLKKETGETFENVCRPQIASIFKWKWHIKKATDYLNENTKTSRRNWKEMEKYSWCRNRFQINWIRNSENTERFPTTCCLLGRTKTPVSIILWLSTKSGYILKIISVNVRSWNRECHLHWWQEPFFVQNGFLWALWKRKDVVCNEPLKPDQTVSYLL